MQDNKRKEKPFLYSLLIESKNRKWRYLILTIVLGIICFDQVYANFGYSGNELFIFTVSAVFTLYLLAATLNIRILAPFFLHRKRYARYLISLSIMVLVFVFIEIGIESYLKQKTISNYTLDYIFSMPSLFDNISFFFLMLICILGTSMPFILKQWMMENELISELEKIRVESQVQQFKDMVDPDFLSNTIQQASSLMLTDREQASGLLYKLSQVLRYQLYDSVRERVLFGAELKFISQYLALQKSHHQELEYSIEINKEDNRLVVAPLIFVPLISEILSFQTAGGAENLKIEFLIQHNNIQFTCSTTKNNLSDIDFSKIEQRLGLVYKDKYQLTTSPNSITLKIEAV